MEFILKIIDSDILSLIYSYCIQNSINKFYFSLNSRKQALQAKLEAEKEGIVVPLTLEEYCLKPKPNPNNQEPQVSNQLFEYCIDFVWGIL